MSAIQAIQTEINRSRHHMEEYRAKVIANLEDAIGCMRQGHLGHVSSSLEDVQTYMGHFSSCRNRLGEERGRLRDLEARS